MILRREGLLRIMSMILALGSCGRFIHYQASIASTCSAFEQKRLSILRPWTTSARADETHNKDPDVLLGWTLEIRNRDAATYHVQVGWKGARTQPTTDVEDEERLMKSIADQHDGVVTARLPYLSEESSLASSLWPGSLAAAILCQSPSMIRALDDASVLELGSGLGLTGTVASMHSASCRLTDNDTDVLDALARLFRDEPNVRVERLDWRDDHPISSCRLADVVVSSDVAYYYYLLRPLMDTVQRYLRRDGRRTALWLCVGQANREAQWQLYHNLRYGCYNQLLDVHEGPWPGTTATRLFRLEMYHWQDSSSIEPRVLDGVLPVAALVHEANPSGSEQPFSFCERDHVATKKDFDSLYMTF
jgi:predicted nicotinamide N-methyase